ncbi:MAG TPA: FkbM family methyltransferase [Longimicrobium sp.]|nr:FkbM family methyltransferase [Longimicrobium sp.]
MDLKQIARKARRLARPEILSESQMLFDTLAPGGPGVLVDVGAHVGGSLRPFAQAGWTVLGFEPDEVNREQLRRGVGALPNVRIDPRAVTVRAGETLPFYRSSESTGISTLTPFVESHVEAGSVTSTTLADARAEYGIEAIDLLKVDTEGYDLMVLRSLDWEAIRPRVVLCEFEDRKTVPLGYTWGDMAGFLVGHGYTVVVAEWYPVQRYGAAHRFRRFADYPCELADPAATGNLLAFREPRDLARFAEIRRRYLRWISLPMPLSRTARRIAVALGR